MPNTIQTVSRSDIARVGDGTFYINNKLYNQVAYDKYREVGAPNNFVIGPDFGAVDANNNPITGSAPVTKYVSNFRTTDMLFAHIALGEGELTSIAPDGPQDIEIDDSTIDDLVNLDTDGEINTDNFHVDYRLGTSNQSHMPLFGDAVRVPKSFRIRVPLKKGTHGPSSMASNDTSAQAWDQIKFNYIVTALYVQDQGNGNFSNRTIRLRATIYDHTKSNVIAQQEKTIVGHTTTELRVTQSLFIPEEHRNEKGYKFEIEKLTDESDATNVRDDIFVVGWTEVEFEPFQYPNTALIGYGLKSIDKYTGSIPNFTVEVKGVAVKVPSNYNQPVINRDGTYEIDWRELECSNNVRANTGITLSDAPSTVLTGNTALHPTIYKGVWDGTFKEEWSENPAWIIYHILTSKRHGLGINESYIDKYSFYRSAQYCDDCDPETGTFNASITKVGNGWKEHKPRGMFTGVREVLVGEGNNVTDIAERRFIFGVSIESGEKAIDVINKLVGSIRGVVNYASGKLSLTIDRPNEIPNMLFNDTNIEQGSISRKGIKENEIVTSVEATYFDPTNSFKRSTVTVDTNERVSGNDNLSYDRKETLDLYGVPRESQATRACQFIVAASRYGRRTVSFSTGSEALNLSLGDTFSLSTNDSGAQYGYSGRIDSASGSNVVLKHYTSPGVPRNVFTSNTLPLSLKVLHIEDDTIDTFVIDSNVSITSDKVLNDTIEVSILNRVGSNSGTPITKDDIWSLGEWDSNTAIYTSQTDKIFKTVNLEKDPENNTITVTGGEYVSNVYEDSEKLRETKPLPYKRRTSSYLPPPAPILTVAPIEKTAIDGTTSLNLQLGESTNREFYSADFSTDYFIAKPTNTISAEAISRVGNNIQITVNSPIADSSSYILTGKNGFSTSISKIPLLCNGHSKVTISESSLGAIRLQIPSIGAFSGEYSLNQNNNLYNLSPGDEITIPFIEKQETENFSINRVRTTSEITTTIHSIENGIIQVYNKEAASRLLDEILPLSDFYILVNQNITRADARLFVQGKTDIIRKSGFIDNIEVLQIELDCAPHSKDFVDLRVDGIKRTNFTLNGTAITFTPTSTDTYYEIIVQDYKTPVIEVNDSVALESGESFTVANTSYIAGTSYNSDLTNSRIYFVNLNKTPASNVVNQRLVNVSKDPQGYIISANTFTSNIVLESKSSEYQGNFTLPCVYKLQKDAIYQKVNPTNLDSIAIEKGTTLVAARNRSTTNRLSPYVSDSVEVDNISIGNFLEVSLTERITDLQLKGILSTFDIAFTPSNDPKVTDYEIRYRWKDEWNTIVEPADSALTNGKIIYSVFGVERGEKAGTNTFYVEVTPVNKKLRGPTTKVSKLIEGKSIPPRNVRNFIAAQKDQVINFSWLYYTDSNGDNVDPDLDILEIKRIPGRQDATISNFTNAVPYLAVAAGSIRKSAPVTSIGEFTFLVRTKDTSGNYSDEVVGTTLNVTQTKVTNIIRSYSEDDPSTAYNNTESDYPSITDANAISSNGSAKGFTVTTDSTDIRATENATYITPIRDMGANITGDILTTSNAEVTIASTYREQYVRIGTGTTEPHDGTIEVFSAFDTPNFIGAITSVNLDTSTYTPSSNIGSFMASATKIGFPSDAYGTGGYYQYTEGTTEYQILLTHSRVPGEQNETRNYVRSRAVGSNTWGAWDTDISSYIIADANDTTVTYPKVAQRGYTSIDASMDRAFGFLYDNGTKLFVPQGTGKLYSRNRTLQGGAIDRLVDNTFVGAQGIGAYLNAQDNLRYDRHNKTLMSGDASGNVYAIVHPATSSDTANIGAYALISRVINSTSIQFGDTFYANGVSTGTSLLPGFSNLAADYALVDLTQYSDFDTDQTYQGDTRAITPSFSIRTAITNPYYSNGAVNVAAFVSTINDDNFEPYEPGSRNFRYFQVKLDIVNTKPDSYNYLLDKLRYDVSKQRVTEAITTEYTGSAKTVDISSLGLFVTPTVSLDVEGNTPVLTTIDSRSPTSITYSLWEADGTTRLSSNRTVRVLITGV